MVGVMKTDINKELVNTLAELLHKNNLTEIEYDANGVRLKVVSAYPSSVVPPHIKEVVVKAPEKAIEPKNEVKKNPDSVVKSPMVGVIYIASEPGASPYVKVGDTVKKGQILFLIEAMKTFNAVRAHKAGKVGDILIQNAQPVEFDEPLLILE